MLWLVCMAVYRSRANLFVPPGGGDAIYLVGVSSGDHSMGRSIVISKSTDAGQHWATPSVLFSADR